MNNSIPKRVFNNFVSNYTSKLINDAAFEKKRTTWWRQHRNEEPSEILKNMLDFVSKERVPNDNKTDWVKADDGSDLKKGDRIIEAGNVLPAVNSIEFKNILTELKSKQPKDLPKNFKEFYNYFYNHSTAQQLREAAQAEADRVAPEEKAAAAKEPTVAQQRELNPYFKEGQGDGKGQPTEVELVQAGVEDKDEADRVAAEEKAAAAEDERQAAEAEAGVDDDDDDDGRGLQELFGQGGGKRKGTKRKGTKRKGSKKRKGTKRKGTKRKGTKRKGTKRRGTKRKGTKRKGTKRKGTRRR